jgi:micrococcal nuclease
MLWVSLYVIIHVRKGAGIVNNLRGILLLVLLCLLMPSYVLAHNGTRDNLGGHYRNSDCMYLLHEPTALAKSAKHMDELISLIKANNSNTACGANLTASRVDLEGYSFDGTGKAVPAQESAPARSAAATPNPTTASSTSSGKQLALGQTYPATLVSCIDGDTAVFKINGKEYSTRFLFIDTPESTKEKEAFGKEASRFTCSFLKKGAITLETDGPTLFDKYDRLLAWVFVDGVLEQEAVAKAGLVEDFYDYGTYKYEDTVRKAMDEAKQNHAGMYAADMESGASLWSEFENPIMGFVVVALLLLGLALLIYNLFKR